MAKSASKKPAKKAAKPAAKAAPKTVILPWIRIEDYKTLKSLTAADMTMPETFHQWIAAKNQEFAKLQSDGVAAERYMVRPAEFDAWCQAKGAKRNEASLKAYAEQAVGK
jgi:hypothetical protein